MPKKLEAKIDVLIESQELLNQLQKSFNKEVLVESDDSTFDIVDYRMVAVPCYDRTYPNQTPENKKKIKKQKAVVAEFRSAVLAVVRKNGVKGEIIKKLVKADITLKDIAGMSK